MRVDRGGGGAGDPWLAVEEGDAGAAVAEQARRREADAARSPAHQGTPAVEGPGHERTTPPFTPIVWPVTYEASSDRSQAMAPAMSSPVPWRPSGTFRRT